MQFFSSSRQAFIQDLQRLGPPHTPGPDIDRPPDNDTRGLPRLPQCNCSHHGAPWLRPAPAYHQNAFGTLATKETNEESVNKSVATQVAALTYQSQLSASNAANTSICQEQQMAHLASQQQLMQENMHHLIAGLNAVTLNQSDEGCGFGHFSPPRVQRRIQWQVRRPSKGPRRPA